MRATLAKKLTESIKLWLARRRLIVLAEAINHEKKIYRLPKVQDMAYYTPKRVPRKRTLPPTM